MVRACAAIDLGATSGRVMLGRFDRDGLSLSEGHRFANRLVDVDGYRCWDLDGLVDNVMTGVGRLCEDGELHSVGVDSWGVDFVLLDEGGARVGPPVSYRDDRTEAAVGPVFHRMPQAELYRRTGIQHMRINTVFQLAAIAQREPHWLERARHFLMVPDYVHYRLCGAMACEYTDASTTEMLDVRTRDWDDAIVAAAGAPRRLFTTPRLPGTVLGPIVRGPARSACQVILPGSHDTASAVAATPLAGDGDAFISSGTWSLMGVESLVPFSNETARAFNITNEGGIDGRYRVLKNIMGMWLLERLCTEAGRHDVPALVAQAETLPPWRALIDPNHESLLAPDDMHAAITRLCVASGQAAPDSLAAFARCVFDSLAMQYRQVKEELEALTGRTLDRVIVVGGGGRNHLLNQLAADACGIAVEAGPAEASALGNICVQLIAHGDIAGLEEARALIRRSHHGARFEPRRDPATESAWRRFGELRAVQARTMTDPDL